MQYESITNGATWKYAKMVQKAFIGTNNLYGKKWYVTDIAALWVDGLTWLF